MRYREVPITKQDTPLQIAQRLLADRRPYSALKIVDNILEQRPDHWSALMRRAKILEWLGDFAAARTTYVQAGESGAKTDVVETALARIAEIERQIEDGKKCLSDGDAKQARAILSNARKKRSSAVVELHLARAELANGQLDDAEELIEDFLRERPGHKLARKIKAEIAEHQVQNGPSEQPKGKAKKAKKAKKASPRKGADPAATFLANLPDRIAALDAAIGNDDESDAKRHIQWLRSKTEHLGVTNWADDLDHAKAAHFAFAKSPTQALRNYDPALIAKSVEYGYIIWPRRIQDYVVHRSVLDVGCGFGAFGNGFLVAGAKSYTGIDPQMPLDSSTVKNKRKRKKADLGVTPNQIMERCPDIHLINGVIEDLETKATFDAVVLHNVTEHLHNIRQIIPNIRTLLNPDGHLIYHHHNFYCWNGHHKMPNRPEQYVPGLAEHDEVADWNHILIAPDLPEDHYFNTNLNQIRLDEIKDITYDNYDVVKWVEIESPEAVAERLTDDVFARLRDFDDSLTRRDLMVNAALCVAKLK
ncbi:tetratricopeptide repeat protein [Parasphingopyxis algicola]|uniref:class I SAM-dependent methyltransferase n=1 Tax=Parasphingopyxis algicola TaxID=2026624 RepID=UPI0015A06A23|nr:class I SAM-dependent methyltransferase [Parasphingopyxis algicola]QLC25973.1 tetratricopeptide repeat protein [Parasphingopyxis algicola]